MCCNNAMNRSSRGCGCGCGCGRQRRSNMDGCCCCCDCCCGGGGAATLPSFPDWPVCEQMERDWPVYISLPATSSRGSANLSAAVEMMEQGCGCPRG